MKTQITPAQAENALDAIQKIKVKSLNSPAGYALAKNTMVLNRVLKDFVKFREAAKADAYPDNEKVDPSSQKHAELTQLVMAKGHAPVDVDVHQMKMSQLFAVAVIEDISVITSLDFILVDDIELDAAIKSE